VARMAVTSITMPAARSARGRRRGAIGWLPSGSARVKVYLGVDQLTGKEIWLRGTVKAPATRRETKREADTVLTKLLNKSTSDDLVRAGDVRA
jgi:integrase